MGKQCADAKQLGEPHEVVRGDPEDDDDEAADGNLPDRCPRHRLERKQWRDRNAKRRKAAREAEQPVTPDEPWNPSSLRKKHSPITVDVEDRDQLYDLLAGVNLAAAKIRQAAKAAAGTSGTGATASAVAGAGARRLTTMADQLTEALDRFHEMFDFALPRGDLPPPLRTSPGSTTRRSAGRQP